MESTNCLERSLMMLPKTLREESVDLRNKYLLTDCSMSIEEFMDKNASREYKEFIKIFCENRQQEI